MEEAVGGEASSVSDLQGCLYLEWKEARFIYYFVYYQTLNVQL